ncbi:thiamine diphosphokinase [uncultured Flavonifractor sp.]|uniref:thiamine diphosphokinase n=1 Tax=uncultured Flavonifractor sp. TaxID=1193534 RepID=UPI00262BF202|nr:thiamine diphosphokinase [uncultured Flavonifractor sp.]
MATEGICGLIVGAAPWTDGAFLTPYLEKGRWTVFCADGGYANALSAGLRPDFLIGDWDSGTQPELEVPCITLPVEKDMTDLQAAMDQALSMGITQLLLCGCTGGRLDHTASNLLLLEWLADRGGQGMIVDGDNEVRLLTPGHFLVEDRPHYHYLSLIPLDRTVSGVTLRGMKYPLEQTDLTRGDTLSISNEPRRGVVELTIAQGRALLIRSQREETAGY